MALHEVDSRHVQLHEDQYVTSLTLNQVLVGSHISNFSASDVVFVGWKPLCLLLVCI